MEAFYGIDEKRTNAADFEINSDQEGLAANLANQHEASAVPLERFRVIRR